MNRKTIAFMFVALLLLDIGAILVLARNRFISHVLMCDIRESQRDGDFNWQPEHAPSFFKFEPAALLKRFRFELGAVKIDKADDFQTVLSVSGYVWSLCAGRPERGRLRWGSPEELLSQCKRKVYGFHCYHRSILLSSFLTSAGIRSRLWTFEGRGFDGNAHTVNEAYSVRYGKWVFIDVTLDCYARAGDVPLSCLELRHRILSGDLEDVSLVSLTGGLLIPKERLVYKYRQLMPCALLRCRNDFASIFRSGRVYGDYSFLSGLIDKLPNGARIGLGYILGGNGVFLHYIDRYSQPLSPALMVVKIMFVVLLFVHVVAFIVFVY